MKANELINKWGMEKYGEHYNLPEDTVFALEVEDRDSGYCETCSSPYSAVVVYAAHPTFKEKTGPSWNRKDTDKKEVDEMQDVEIHSLLNEILAVG